MLLLFSIFPSFGQDREDLVKDSTNLYFIEDITILGNHKTKDRIIERELNVRTGDVVTISALDRLIKESDKNLTRLGLFNYITFKKELLPFNRVIINLTVEERWFILPELSIINNERNFNSWWKTRDFSRLDYRLKVKQNNVFGLNHTISIALSRGYTREISLAYYNISIGKSQRHLIDASIHYSRQSSAHYKSYNNKPEAISLTEHDAMSRETAEIVYNFRPKHNSTHICALSYRKVQIADTLHIVRSDILANKSNINRYFQFSYSYTFDNRNDASYPLTGNKIQFSIVKRGLGLIKKYPVNLMYLYTDLRQFYKITHRLYGAHSLHIKKSIQTNTPYYYKSGLGYRDYIRGFEYYAIESEDHYILKNTLNFELLPKIISTINFIPIKKFKKIHYSIFLNTFFDIGYGHEKDAEIIAANNLSNKWLYSVGLGLNFVTYYDNVLRLEYSYNSIDQSGLFIHFKAAI